MESLITSIALAFVVFVWLKTNAFIDFLGNILSWKNILYVADYNNQPIVAKNNLCYPLWLYVNHPCFWTKLISCPLCLSFWLNIIIQNGFTEKLFGAFITLLFFSILDKVYKHG